MEWTLIQQAPTLLHPVAPSGIPTVRGSQSLLIAEKTLRRFPQRTHTNRSVCTRTVQCQGGQESPKPVWAQVGGLCSVVMSKSHGSLVLTSEDLADELGGSPGLKRVGALSFRWDPGGLQSGLQALKKKPSSTPSNGQSTDLCV